MIQYLKKWLKRTGFVRRETMPSGDKDRMAVDMMVGAVSDHNQVIEKKQKQFVSESDWFWQQMEAIAEGKRKHPAMMTSLERHLQTVAEIQKLDWTGFADNHGVCSGFEGIRSSVQVKGSAQGFLSLLTPEERDELRKIIREEMAEASSKQQNNGEWK